MSDRDKPRRGFAQDQEIEAESVRVLEQQQAALRQLSNMLAGGRYLLSAWVEMHQAFFAKAAERLASAQEEEGVEAQKDRIGKIARENANDYMEMMAKVAHEAALVSERIIRSGTEELTDMAAKMQVKEKEVRTRKANDADARSKSPTAAEKKR